MSDIRISRVKRILHGRRRPNHLLHHCNTWRDIGIHATTILPPLSHKGPPLWEFPWRCFEIRHTVRCHFAVDSGRLVVPRTVFPASNPPCVHAVVVYSDDLGLSFDLYIGHRLCHQLASKRVARYARLTAKSVSSNRTGGGPNRCRSTFADQHFRTSPCIAARLRVSGFGNSGQSFQSSVGRTIR